MKPLGKVICEQNCLMALGLTEIEIKVIIFIFYTSVFWELRKKNHETFIYSFS